MLVNNIIFNGLNQVITILSPLVIQYHLVRTLNVEQLSEIYFLLSAFMFNNLINSFSSIEGVSRISKINEFNEKIKIISEIVSFLFFSNILVSILALIYVYNTTDIGIFPILLFVIPFMTVSFSGDYILQALLKNKILTLRRLVIKVFLIIFVLHFITDQSSYMTYLILINLFLIFEHLITFIYNYNIFKEIRLGLNYFFLVIRSKYKLLIFIITYNIIPNLFIITTFQNDVSEVAAKTSILMKLILVATTFISTAVMVLIPVRNKNQDANINKKNIFLIYTIITSIFIYLVLNLSEELVLFLFLKDIFVESYYLDVLALYIIFNPIINYILFDDFINNEKYNIPLLLNFIQITCFGILLIHNVLNIFSFIGIYIICSLFLLIYRYFYENIFFLRPSR